MTVVCHNLIPREHKTVKIVEELLVDLDPKIAIEIFNYYYVKASVPPVRTTPRIDITGLLY